MTVLAPPLDEVSRRARPYPAHLLPEGGTGLALFAAAFQGHNDAIHMARRDMTVTCVDTNRARLRRMARLYPESWRFVAEDAWVFADRAAEQAMVWDAVTVDPFTDLIGKAVETLEAWCCLARTLVTVGIMEGQAAEIPYGWSGYRFPRGTEVEWLVLTR